MAVVSPGAAWGASFAIALAAVLLNLRAMMPEPLPGPTYLSVYPWPKPITISPLQLGQYRQDGYLILRQVIPPEVVGALRTFAGPNMKSEFWDYVGSSIGTVYVPWVKYDLFRDFLWYGPLAQLASQVLGGVSIRLFADHLFYLSGADTPGLSLHNGMDRAFDQHMYVRFWIPLDDIDTSTTGGSLETVSMRDLAEEHIDCQDLIRGRNVTVESGAVPITEATCIALAEKRKVAHNLSRGDAIVLAPGVLRASQPLVPDGGLSARYAISASFSVDDLSVLAEAVPRYKQNALLQVLHPLPECYYIKARPECHPLLSPSRLQHETDARMEGTLYHEPSALSKVVAWAFSPLLHQREQHSRSKS